MRTKFILISLLLLVVSGCRDESLDELRGRYHGLMSIAGVTSQVVAEVPTVKDKGDFKTLEFSIFRTLGTAKAERVFVQSTDSFLTIQSPLFGNREYRLTLNSDNCGVGENSGEIQKLCVAPGKINFDITSKASGQMVISIHLLRDDTLPPAPKSDELQGKYSLDELVGRARFNNYAVSQEAERVFQAKQRIKIAIGNLLPHFNMKDLLAFVSGGPLGAIEAIGSLMPYIFPSNWYKWDEAKELESAKRKSFASLRGNEMQYVESFYYLVSRDLAIQDIMEKGLAKQDEIHRVIEKREILGLLPRGSAEKYQLNLLLLEQDLVQLKTLISLEHSSLAHAVALPASTGIKQILPIGLPDLATENSIDANKYIKEAQTRSFEAATFDFLIEASRQNTKAHAWGFLDPNSNDVMGFGYAAMLNVGESSERELANKKEETLSLIDQRTVIAATEYNNSLRSFRIAEASLKNADDRLKTLLRRLQVGDDRVNDEYFVQEMSDASSILLKASANRITAVYALLMAKSKVERLVLKGFYQDLELTVE
ncbi:MAG: hypothetical protein SGJ18_02835 [Pseudomonadota bacterium]|nr:hypothetical protein [Pseudomonadota bacterium]